MKPPLLVFLMLAPLAVAGPLQGPASVPGLKVPAGFTVTEFVGPELANDIYCLTISPAGEIVVSGRGYVKQLVDDNGDGRADRAILLADHPKDGAMGLLVDDGHLYVMGDGGLRRMPWKPGAFTDKSELLVKLKTGGEHAAHAISRGPDGMLYLLCGNMSGVPGGLQLTGPIPTPVGGYVLRISPDFQSGEILCDGFRNAYGFDWSTSGELFTYDSDNERCLGLPWYEGTRFYRIERHGHYGWRSPQLGEFWRLPPYYPDVVAPLSDLGRGSPTGVVCYRHQQFPEEYRDGFFLLEWTFGVIHFARVRGTWAETSDFLRAEAGHGFAPTAAAVHPNTGDLYVSTGGRGTCGAVYRIRHEAGFRTLPAGAKLATPQREARSKTFHSRWSRGMGDPENLFNSFARETDPRKQLLALRLLIKSLGEIGTKSAKNACKEGYSFTPLEGGRYATWRPRLLAGAWFRFPSGNRNLDRELSRVFALFQEEHRDVAPQLLQKITADSHPTDDMHYLFVLASCRVKLGEATRRALAQALVQLDVKYIKLNLPREKNWALRLEEAYQALIDRDPKLPQELLKHPDFGRPDHLLFTKDARFPRREAAELWLRRIGTDRDYPWSSELVQLLGELPASQIATLLRSKWEETSLREALLPVLSKLRDPEDRERLVVALRFLKADAVRAAVEALPHLPPATGPARRDEVVSLVFSLRRWHQDDKKLAALLATRLASLTHQDLGVDPARWTAWAVAEYPASKTVLEASDGVDRTKWDVRLRGVDWKHANVQRGETLFKQHCAACHQGTSAVGPDLAGVGKRFSHDDLLTATLQPSKDVPARYRSSVVVTHAGQVHVGLVIYEAVDGVILQTGTSTTLRVAGDQIASRRETDQSLMPAGLLDSLKDEQIADLLAYLKQ
jgi:putative heme-binding domain-containing protein